MAIVVLGCVWWPPLVIGGIRPIVFNQQFRFAAAALAVDVATTVPGIAEGWVGAIGHIHYSLTFGFSVSKWLHCIDFHYTLFALFVLPVTSSWPALCSVSYYRGICCSFVVCCRQFLYGNLNLCKYSCKYLLRQNEIALHWQWIEFRSSSTSFGKCICLYFNNNFLWKLKFQNFLFSYLKSKNNVWI